MRVFNVIQLIKMQTIGAYQTGRNHSSSQPVSDRVGLSIRLVRITPRVPQDFEYFAVHNQPNGMSFRGRFPSVQCCTKHTPNFVATPPISTSTFRHFISPPI
jgi:hypothetical protein